MMDNIKKIILDIPGFRKIYNFLKRIIIIKNAMKSPFLQTYPPGHYYSPIPDIEQILNGKDVDSRLESKECKGIDLNEVAQLDLLDKVASYYKDLPFSVEPSETRRFYYDNSYFSYADAIVLFGMLKHFKPCRVIEVGSGFSSALMLDTNESFLCSSTRVTFIEPFPDRLNSLLKEKDRLHSTIITKPIQEVDLDVFNSLNENDILFIDSSHVAKFRSDVNFILFEILPRLKRGVIVHFHDICWPFEYPIDWLAVGRAWNEAYLLRAFLQYNTSFEILYFNSFINSFHREKLKDKMPLCLNKSSYVLTKEASSLWLKKTV
jgi:hypothetical protein